jgi:hypothetical protein
MNLSPFHLRAFGVGRAGAARCAGARVPLLRRAPCGSHPLSRPTDTRKVTMSNHTLLIEELQRGGYSEGAVKCVRACQERAFGGDTTTGALEQVDPDAARLAKAILGDGPDPIQQTPEQRFNDDIREAIRGASGFPTERPQA